MVSPNLPPFSEAFQMTHDDALAILPGPGDIHDWLNKSNVPITMRGAEELLNKIADFMTDESNDLEDDDEDLEELKPVDEDEDETR